MTIRHQCSGGGVLVPADGLYGPEPFDFESRELASTVVGCNNLVCTSCSQPVRQQPGIASGSEFIAGQGLVRTTMDWSTLVARDVLRTSVAVRFYACGCTAFDANSTYRLDEIDEMRPMPPWRCAGHLQLDLPRKVDGITFHEKMDVSTLARDYFRGALAENPAIARWGIDWLNRIFVALDAQPLARKIASTVAALLRTDEPLFVVNAATFFELHPQCDEAQELAAVYRERLDYLRSHQNPGQAGRSLEWWVLRALAARLAASEAENPPVRDLLRELAIGPDPVPNAALEALRKRDTAFVTAHLSALRLANPSWR